MVKAYLVHRLLDTFGIVASPKCNTAVHPSLEVCFSGGNEAICVWDLRESTSARKLTVPQDTVNGIPRHDNVTRLLPAVSKSTELFAGYSNGDLRLWNWRGEKCLANFQGHRGPIMALTQSLDGHLVASGGADHDILIWDVSVRQARFRLSGHAQQLTGLAFLYPTTFTAPTYLRLNTKASYLVSGSLDGQLKLWHLETQRCVQTVSTHSTAAVQSLIVMPDQRHILVGMATKNVEVFAVKSREEYVKLSDAESELLDDDAEFVITFAGVLERHSGSKKVAEMTVYGCPDDDALPSAEGEFKTFTTLPNGTYLSNDGCSLHVPDQRALIFMASYSQHLEVIRAQNQYGQRRRELRILIRRAEKLKRKSTKLQEGGKADKELSALIGSNWHSNLAIWEKSELLKVEQAMELLKKITQSKKAQLQNRKRQAPETDSVSTQAESEDKAPLFTPASAAAMTFQVMSERFDLIGRAVSISAGPVLLVSTAQNQIESYRLDKEAFFDAPGEEMSLIQRVTKNRSKLGNREGLLDVATKVCLSNDDRTLMTLSTGQVALWDVINRNCRLRMDCNNTEVSKTFKPLSGFFLAGDEYVICGDHQGQLNLFHIPTATRVLDKNVHEGAINAMALHPQMTLFVTAGADNKLRLHRFRLDSSKSVSVKSVKSVELADTPNDVRFSPDGSFVAVALASSQVFILFTDTLKTHLTLYGHSLPVTSLAWSTDGQMLATGSLDRHIKVWDTEFGNILRSIPTSRSGHVTNLLFSHQTHYVVSTLSTGEVKMYDVDEGERIVTLSGAPVDILSLAASRDTELIFCSCADRTVKVWERTDQQMFLTEEREREVNIEMLKESERSDQALPSSAALSVVTAARPTRKDIEVVRNTEMLIEVVREAEEQEVQFKGYATAMKEFEASEYKTMLPIPPKPSAKPELMGRSPDEHVVAALGTLTRENTTEVLLGLPFKVAIKILEYLTVTLEGFCSCILENENLAPLRMSEADVAIRIATVLIHAHRRYLSNATQYHCLLRNLQKYMKQGLDFELGIVRRNMVALSFLAKTIKYTT